MDLDSNHPDWNVCNRDRNLSLKWIQYQFRKGIWIWIWVSGNMFCIILCSHRIWNPSLSPNLNPSLAVEITIIPGALMSRFDLRVTLSDDVFFWNPSSDYINWTKRILTKVGFDSRFHSYILSAMTIHHWPNCACEGHQVASISCTIPFV